jgi:Tol biopolymer transport system component
MLTFTSILTMSRQNFIPSCVGQNLQPVNSATLRHAAVVAGPKIVFGSVRNNGNHDIFVMDFDGSNETRLTTHLGYDDQPKWSPDGSKIVFMSGRDGNFEIYSMNADGSSPTRLTNNPAADGFPAWSPDGTRIAFVSGNLEAPGTFEIFVMNANGTNRTQLTNDNLVDGVPAWSPDSSAIVFMSGTTTVFDPNSFEIFKINADGSNRTRLTTNSVVDGQPAYSPDGTKILFASGDAMNPNGIEIFVMNSNGTNRTQLTNNSVTDAFPAWSPDGTKIVFASGNIADETTAELFTMNADGSNRTKIGNNAFLDWFPNCQINATPVSQIQLSAATFTAGEGATTLNVGVNRTGDTSTAATINYATSDTAANACNTTNGQASSRCDYLRALGTLTFAAGEISKSISISIVDDVYAEGLESFTITLSNPINSTLGAPASATLNITDNESVTGTNPIDQVGFFVRQHYLDFLNREPDTDGFNFWTNQINSCGADAQCIELKRINVSGAFFLSIEFQETGYLVYRAYKVAFGNLTTPPGAPVPIVLSDFLRDTQRIGQGVQVNVGNWQQQLEANKVAYMLAFVQRPDFGSAFPAGMSPSDFVTQLNTRAGGVLSPAEQANLISIFGGTTSDVNKRAQVLRAVAEDTDLRNAEFNKAFVLMQYFGYLRRNPNEAPDTNFDGFNFWLGKLNQFSGNFVNAEMVKAFLISGEYRQRFGP